MAPVLQAHSFGRSGYTEIMPSSRRRPTGWSVGWVAWTPRGGGRPAPNCRWSPCGGTRTCPSTSSPSPTPAPAGLGRAGLPMAPMPTRWRCCNLVREGLSARYGQSWCSTSLPRSPTCETTLLSPRRPTPLHRCCLLMPSLKPASSSPPAPAPSLARVPGAGRADRCMALSPRDGGDENDGRMLNRRIGAASIAPGALMNPARRTGRAEAAVAAATAPGPGPSPRRQDPRRATRTSAAGRPDRSVYVRLPMGSTATGTSPRSGPAARAVQSPSSPTPTRPARWPRPRPPTPAWS